MFKKKSLNKSFLTKEVTPAYPSEFEDLDKIIQEKGLKFYSKLLYDEQVKFCLGIKKFLILSGGWEIIPRDDKPESIEQAKFIQDNFNSLKRAFSSVLYSILTALDYGFSISEMIFKEENNKLVLSDIKTKLPWIFSFEYDDYGNLTKIFAYGEEIPREKFII